MSLFNFGKNSNKVEEKSADNTIEVTNSTVENCIQVVKGEDVILISSQEFLFKRDHNGTEDKFRLMGTDGTLLLTEKELSHIFTKFTELTGK